MNSINRRYIPLFCLYKSQKFNDDRKFDAYPDKFTIPCQGQIYIDYLFLTNMFESLKKKIGGWFKKESEEGLKEFGEEKRKPKKEKARKEIGKKVVKVSKPVLEEEEMPSALKVLSTTPYVVGIPTSKKAFEKEKIIEEEKAKAKEEEIEELAEEKSGGFFARLARKITTSALAEEDFNLFFDEFEMVLLENNVALEVVDKIRIGLKNSLVGKLFKKSEAQEKIKESLKRAIGEVLIEGIDLISEIKKKNGVYVIVFFGVNGSGKTTSIAKIAYYLKKEGISVVLGAADTFRAASIEQLKTHGEKLGVDVIASSYGADPAAVAFDAIKRAEKHKKKVVLIDTAGRMHTAKNLMKEMEKIIRVANPDLKIFVGESITGNDVVSQARTFNESIGIDGIILAKADVDEKSGAILSVGYVTSKPILFLGVGQRYGDLRKFEKEDVWKGLGLE